MRSTATYGTTLMHNRWGVCLHLWINAQREAACACSQDAILDRQLISWQSFRRPLRNITIRGEERLQPGCIEDEVGEFNAVTNRMLMLQLHAPGASHTYLSDLCLRPVHYLFTITA